MLEARRNDSHGVLVTNGKNVGRLGKLITAVSEGVLLQGASGRLIVGSYGRGRTQLIGSKSQKMRKKMMAKGLISQLYGSSDVGSYVKLLMLDLFLFLWMH